MSGLGQYPEGADNNSSPWNDPHYDVRCECGNDNNFEFWDEDDEVIGFLTEIDYTIPSLQNMTFKAQLDLWDKDISDSGSIDSTLAMGSSYKVNQNITLRLAYFHDLVKNEGERERMVMLQFYFFGE